MTPCYAHRADRGTTQAPTRSYNSVTGPMKRILTMSATLGCISRGGGGSSK